MRTPSLFALALASLVAACGPSPANPDGGDAGGDAGPPCTDCNDAINLHCTSAAGEEAAAPCNTRLQAMAMGATFFIGDRRSCYPNPNNANCRPLCELSSMSFTNTGSAGTPAYCEFTPPMLAGCKINERTGYAVVVQAANGRRSIAGVGNDGSCASAGAQNRRWALVGFEDLQTASTCAQATPEGGYEPTTTFVGCDMNSDLCTAASRTTCQERMYRVMTMAGPQTYSRSFCSRMCTGDAECGSSGRCVMGDCSHRCGGPCGLSCPDTFTCNDGTCIPTPL